MAISIKTSSLIGSALSVALLSGCSSTQQNPNYQYSSRYDQQQGQQTPPQVFETQMPLETTAADFVEIYPTETVGQPVAQPVIPELNVNIAPTDAEFEYEDATGTPGYMAFHGDAPHAELVTEQTPTLTTAAAGEAIDYDYSQNLVATGAYVTPDYTDDVRVMGNSYTVRQGDTVYGLSKRQCVGLADIQAANGIGADFNIQIGQTITLPASRC